MRSIVRSSMSLELTLSLYLFVSPSLLSFSLYLFSLLSFHSLVSVLSLSLFTIFSLFFLLTVYSPSSLSPLSLHLHSLSLLSSSFYPSFYGLSFSLSPLFHSTLYTPCLRKQLCKIIYVRTSSNFHKF